MTVQCVDCGAGFDVADRELPQPGEPFVCGHCQAERWRGSRVRGRARSAPEPLSSAANEGLNEEDLFGPPSSSEEVITEVEAADAFTDTGVISEVMRSPVAGSESVKAPSPRPNDLSGLGAILFEHGTAPEPMPEGEMVESEPVQPLLLENYVREASSIRSVDLSVQVPEPPPFLEVPRRTAIPVVGSVLGALVLALVLAAAATIYLNDGKFEASAFTRARLKAVLAPTKGLIARDLSNGIYETRSGSSVFYVRGTLENRGQVVGPVKVRGEILDGSTLLKTMEGFAGGATPEDLYQIDGVEEVNALNRREGHAPVKLAPGEEAPFLLALFDPPPDLSGFRISITAAVEDPAGAKTP